MEMHHLPFKPRTLTLAVAAAVLASQPLVKTQAQTRTATSTADSEWSCQVAADGKGWHCTVVPAKSGAMKRAPRPAKAAATATAVKQAEEKTPEPVAKKVDSAPPPVVASTTTSDVRTRLDWVPFEKLSESQKEKLQQETPWCSGMYIEPPRPGKNFRGDPDSAPIVAEADESSYDQSSIATMSGHVQLRQGSRQLESDVARVNRQTNYAEFEGNVVFRETGTLMTGDYGDMLMDSGRASVENAQYVMHESHARGEAGQIVRNEDESMDLAQATYTSCPPGSKGWQLSGESISLDPTSGFGTARDAVIRIEGVPVFYTPYMYFPIDDRRQSGFLYPTVISHGSDNGLEFDLPYYWNIAPNYDATITPRVMSKRGLMLENEFRYLGSQHEGEVGVAGLLNKDQLKDENRNYDQERWLVNLRHKQYLTERWTAELDYADASDKDYTSDFGTSLNLSSSSPLNQKIGTRYMGGDDINHWEVNLQAHKFKNMSHTSDDPYNKLPQLELKGLWQAGETLTVNYLADYTYFSRADDWRYLREVDDPNFDPDDDVQMSIYDEGFGIKQAEGGRAYFESGVSYPMSTTWGFLTPEVKVRSVNYNLTNLNQDDVMEDLRNSYVDTTFSDSDYTESPSTTVPAFSLDSGLYFDRFTDLFGTSYTHTLEPRMKYLYAPYKEGQEFNPVFDTGNMGFSYSSLWKDNRFSGYDRLADANQVSIGVTTRLIEDDGFERMRFGIGQIIYFDDRQVYIANSLGSAGRDEADQDEDVNAEDERLREELTEPTSPIASEFVYNFNRAMSLRQDFAWNPNSNRIDNYGLTYRYHPSGRKALNLGFRFRDEVDRYMKDEDDRNIPIGTDEDGNTIYKTTGNNLKQTDFSFAWPLPGANHWTALGRWQYDLTNDRNLEQLAGVEYNSCCYQVRLFWRSWVEPDDNIDHPDQKSGIFLQFVLSGLGNLTGTSDSEYLEGIKGYSIREK